MEKVHRVQQKGEERKWKCVTGSEPFPGTLAFILLIFLSTWVLNLTIFSRPPPLFSRLLYVRQCAPVFNKEVGVKVRSCRVPAQTRLSPICAVVWVSFHPTLFICHSPFISVGPALRPKDSPCLLILLFPHNTPQAFSEIYLSLAFPPPSWCLMLREFEWAQPVNF